jgi:hypothetical protein
MPPITRSQTRHGATINQTKKEASSQNEMICETSRNESNESKENGAPEQSLETDEIKQSIDDNLIQQATFQNSTEPIQQCILSLHASVERRIFARIHSEFSIQDWKEVIWNTTFRINDLKFWACMTYKGLGSIVQIDLEKKERWETEDEKERRTGLMTLFTGRFAGEKVSKLPYEEKKDRLTAYVGLLKNDITQMMKRQKLKRNQCIFQFIEYIDYADWDISEWINGSKQKFKSIIYGWPENSLDLHPIKPLVDLLQAKLKTEYNTSAEGEKFVERVINQWNSIPLEQVKKSIDETTARLEAVARQK